MDIRDSLLTAQDVAGRLGISPDRIRKLARQRGIGWLVPGTHIRLFIESEVDKLRPRPGPGRPKGEKGNGYDKDS